MIYGSRYLGRLRALLCLIIHTQASGFTPGALASMAAFRPPRLAMDACSFRQEARLAR